MNTIVSGSENVMDMVQRIAIATEEQSSAAEEVSQTMENTAEVINQNLQLSENVKKASGELVSLAKELKAQVGNFKTSSKDNTLTDSRESAGRMESGNAVTVIQMLTGSETVSLAGLIRVILLNKKEDKKYVSGQ
ncbi:MAG: hypothetical protein ABFR82_06535 [Nitrospirota bacterium]